jgi:hypothetical protein
LRSQLKAKCDEELPLAAERFDTRDLEKRFNNLIENPETSYPQTLIVAYSQWKGRPSVLPTDERKKNENELKSLEHRARAAVEVKHFTTLQATINSITNSLPDDIKAQIEAWRNHETVLRPEDRKEKDDTIQRSYLAAVKRVFINNTTKLGSEISSFSGSTEQLAKLIKKCKDFLGQKFNDLEQDIIDSETRKVNNLIGSAIEKHISSLHAQYHQEQMNKDTYSEPSYVQLVKSEILVLMHYDDEKKFNDLIAEKVNTTHTNWKQKQEQKIDEWCQLVALKTPADALDEAKGFFMENSNNPYLYKAKDAVLSIISSEYLKWKNNWENTQTQYLRLKEFCAKVRTLGIKYEPIKNSREYRFAEMYFDMMNKEHRLFISDISVRTDYSDGIYIQNCEYAKKGDPRFTVMFNYDGQGAKQNASKFYSNWKTMPGFTQISLSFEPWDTFILLIRPFQYNCILPDDSLGWFRPNFNISKHSSNTLEWTPEELGRNMHLRITYSLNHSTIKELWERAGI